LFKYPKLVFEQGTFVWGISRSAWLALVVVAFGVAFALFTYSRVRRQARGRDRGILIALRLAAFAVVLFCLARPALILKAAVPQQNFLGVLVDDSRSMQISDQDGKPRGEYIKKNFSAETSPMWADLSKRFAVRQFKFATNAERVANSAALTLDGTSSRLGDALDRARDELSGLPLSGLLVISDGADTADTTFEDSLSQLKAQGIPVFTIGVGQENLGHDIQVSRVDTPRRVLKGTALVVDVVVMQTGYAGQKVPLNVESDGRIIAQETITLPRDGESSTFHMHFTAPDAGLKTFIFRIPDQPAEVVKQNNLRASRLEVYDRKEKVLYYEGEPRFEAKFIRQALEGDENVQVVLLQRTNEKKYLRLGVDDENELFGGFPTTRAELFAYRSIILGSVPASAFTADQLKMIAEFVNVRGGGLLMLGGRKAFSEGGWAGTPVGEVLPVVLTPGLEQAAEYFSQISIEPTREGLEHPATQINEAEKPSPERWAKLPELSTVNRISKVKAGATTLLNGVDEGRTERPVLSYQRYGRGKAIAFAVQDAWLWRMHASMAVEDTTHRTFWRRLLRWLVDDVPDRVEVSASQDTVEPGQPVTIVVEARDKEYAPVNDASAVAHVTLPSGKVEDVPLDWTVAKPGEYKGVFTPSENGEFKVRAGVARGAEDLGSASLSFVAGPSVSEYFDAGMRAPLLRRLAEETGGRFYAANDTAALAEAISYSGRGVTVVDERDLWDMPVNFLLFLGIIGAEWAFRRAKGLA
jgi:uncharacterized membrane protein